MRAFIYDKYGYYPKDEYATSFEYQGWYFKLEISEKNDQEIHALRLMLDEVNQAFEPLGSDIILTRDGHYVSQSEYGPVVLVAIRQGEVSFQTLQKMHRLFFRKFDKVRLMTSHLRNLWIHKSDSIEERILPGLPIDDKEYTTLRYLGQFALGLAENAIQYLLDTAIYYGDEIADTSLCHKRLDEMSSFYMFNPFNFVVDSPMRDLAEIYKNDSIILEDLHGLLKLYPMTGQDASLLLARCIYPSQIFDMLEDYYELKKNVKRQASRYYESLEGRMLKLKKLHRFLVRNYRIRPVNWLE